MLKKFYEKVLPSQGVYCVSGIDKNKKITNRFAETLDDLINTITELADRDQNVFVAPGSFVGHSRKADSSVFLRSFFIDLDVGPGKDYTDKQDAHDALDYLLEQAGLPEPVRVDSGGGIHAYWVFDRDIPTAEWKPYAEKFKAKVTEHIPIDPVVTADAARIMRCPDTLNYKYATPFETKVISTEISVYDFDEMKEYLGLVNDPKAILAGAVKGLDEDTAKILEYENMEYVFNTIAVRSLEGDGCRQIAYILQNAASLSEPLWRAGLSVARRCTDWEESIHLMSDEYPGYSAEETLRKANETLNAKWAYSCNKFNEFNPGGCEGCPYRGKLPSPTHIGKRLKEAEVSVEEDAVREEPDPEKVYALTCLPPELKPYQRGVNGGIYLVAPAKQDKEGKWHQDDPVLIWKHDLFPIKRMYGPDGECMMLRHIMPHDDVRDFLFPMKAAYARDKFQEVMSNHGVFPRAAHMPALMDYVINWGTYMLDRKKAEQTRSQMGWTDDNNGFVIGNIELQRNGNVAKTATSSLVASVAKVLTPKGSYEKWSEAVEKMNIPDMELYLYAVFIGFGSTLMRFTTTRGVSVSYVGETGCGKTGALYAGLSLFGDPVEQSLSGKKDEMATGNALVQWYMNLKNIMMGLDEASNYSPEDVSNLLHKVSSGKNKMRMQSSVNAVRDIEQTAANITMFTSNQSLTDKLGVYKENADGELARLVEFTVVKGQPLVLNPHLGEEIFDVFRTNYGHAGPRYIAYLFEKGEDYIADKVKKYSQKFIDSFGNDTAYRFYKNLISVTFAGAELAKEAGIINSDLDRVYTHIVGHIISNRENSVKLNNSDYEAVLGDFQNMFAQNGTLVMNDDRLVREPRNSLVARIEIDTQRYYVSKREFKTFLSKLQISEKEFVKTMEGKKLLVFKGKIRMAKGWPGMSSSAAVAVYGFTYDGTEEMFKPNA
jgi:hypothetical protein